MSKGHFIDGDGIPVCYATYADKPALHGAFRFVADSVCGPRPSELHAWNGAAWEESATLAARADRLVKLRSLARLDNEVPRPLEDLVAVLIAKGVLAKGDLPEGAQAKLDAKAEARAALAD